jgi:hypothetical protein
MSLIFTVFVIDTQKKGSWDFRGQLSMDNDCPRIIAHEFPRLSTKFFEFLKLSAKNLICPRNFENVHDYGQFLRTINNKNNSKNF